MRYRTKMRLNQIISGSRSAIDRVTTITNKFHKISNSYWSDLLYEFLDRGGTIKMKVLGGSIAGYESTVDEIWLSCTQADGDLLVALAHELTHAMQDKSMLTKEDALTTMLLEAEAHSAHINFYHAFMKDIRCPKFELQWLEVAYFGGVAARIKRTYIKEDA